MTIQQSISDNRRLVTFGITINLALAALVLIRFANATVVDAHEVVGTLALGLILGLPAALAWLSMDRRPSLLPAATLGAVAAGLVTITLAPLFLIPAIIWWRAWRTRPVPVSSPPRVRVARVVLAILMATAVLTLFAYDNPLCARTATDGTVTVDSTPAGHRSGWSPGFGTTTSTGSTSVLGPDVAAETCDSDRIVIAEALGALAIGALVIGAGLRWPQGAGVLRSSREVMTAQGAG